MTAAIDGIVARIEAKHQGEMQRMAAQLEACQVEIARLKAASERQDRSSPACNLTVKRLHARAKRPTTAPILKGLRTLPWLRAHDPHAFRLGRPREGAGVLPRIILVNFTR